MDRLRNGSSVPLYKDTRISCNHHTLTLPLSLILSQRNHSRWEYLRCEEDGRWKGENSCSRGSLLIILVHLHSFIWIFWDRGYDGGHGEDVSSRFDTFRAFSSFLYLKGIPCLSHLLFHCRDGTSPSLPSISLTSTFFSSLYISVIEVFSRVLISYVIPRHLFTPIPTVCFLSPNWRLLPRLGETLLLFVFHSDTLLLTVIFSHYPLSVSIIAWNEVIVREGEEEGRGANPLEEEYKAELDRWTRAFTNTYSPYTVKR